MMLITFIADWFSLVLFARWHDFTDAYAIKPDHPSNILPVPGSYSFCLQTILQICIHSNPHVAWSDRHAQKFVYCVYSKFRIVGCMISLLGSVSSRFVVKPEEGQLCIFNVFLTKPVGVNKNWGARHQRGSYPPLPDKSCKQTNVYDLQ